MQILPDSVKITEESNLSCLAVEKIRNGQNNVEEVLQKARDACVEKEEIQGDPAKNRSRVSDHVLFEHVFQTTCSLTTWCFTLMSMMTRQ